jgi:hypothetical protein
MMVILLAVSMAFAACGAKEEPKTDGGGATTENGAYEAVKLNDVEITVDRVEVVKQVKLGGIEMDEEEGTAYVHVAYSVKNTGTKEITYNSVLASGKLSVTSELIVDNELFADGLLNESLPTGKQVTGEFYFKVSGDETFNYAGMKLEISSYDLLTPGKVEIVLK